MVATTVYASAGASLYLITGGRWTVVLLLLTAYLVLPSPENEKFDIGLKKFAKAKEATFISSTGAVALTAKPKRQPKFIRATKPTNVSKSPSPTLTASASNFLESNIIIFYSSLTGSSQKAAKKLHDNLFNLADLKSKPQLLNLDDDVDDLDDYFVNLPSLPNLVYVLVLPSYDTDSPLDFFLQTLEETANDFRIDKFPLSKLSGFSILGIGDSESWPTNFCYQAKAADKWLSKLGARRIFPMGSVCIKNEGEQKIDEWIQTFAEVMKDDDPIFYDESQDSDNEAEDSDESGTLVDVEDMGAMMKNAANDSSSPDREVKEMVAKNSPTYNSLTKQGYTVVGSHSGVKICRWTKSALRGRGSCYKFAFYGIKSHLCMETTPSLSCSNKCVFCWRHGTNPVGTSWRWQVDGPEMILKGALEGHYKKIKQMRGVPGVVAERFNEAFTVKHCALSLVGEPIFYPYINEFVGMLHDRHISSFLVCNAQHPEQLKNLSKVTQLYVSIDASTKDSLKKVDRPLFKDYWDRLLSCLDTLRTTQRHQRTVFRLTLVKGFNMGDVEGYADMVVRGEPSLIEIKGATFCGSSSGNGNPLTMQNIPFYEECQNFVRNLNKELLKRGYDYGIAAEHAHSCCILMAQSRFKINDKWFTHIDYPKFFELLESGVEFDDLDYVKETPLWAYWESDQAGFNPDDTRFNRKEEKAKKRAEREAKKGIAAVEELF